MTRWETLVDQLVGNRLRLLLRSSCPAPQPQPPTVPRSRGPSPPKSRAGYKEKRVAAAAAQQWEGCEGVRARPNLEWVQTLLCLVPFQQKKHPKLYSTYFLYFCTARVFLPVQRAFFVLLRIVIELFHPYLLCVNHPRHPKQCSPLKSLRCFLFVLGFGLLCSMLNALCVWLPLNNT